ncbi:hypothetical protein PoB_007127400 [Plakobranchus ocellatus]|uniref:Uncharacterized protein n=1 Tax=Plakobranchus ocellatus TaxID=259542 RepID=A0AAV4DKQ6_9GAST|nr:hypothetical protein PoB_007127400 [Plakobranchus ocellatus]
MGLQSQSGSLSANTNTILTVEQATFLLFISGRCSQTGSKISKPTSTSQNLEAGPNSHIRRSSFLVTYNCHFLYNQKQEPWISRPK